MSLARHAADVAGRVLHADDVGKLAQPFHRVDRHVDDAAGRDVVNDDRDPDRVVDGLEVLVKPFLRRLVVVGGHDENGVGAGALGVHRQGDRFGGVVRARSRDDGNASARLVDADVDDAAVLVVLSVGLSPVVPTGTSPCEPEVICQSIKARNVGSSISPSLNGVTSAGIEP